MLEIGLPELILIAIVGLLVIGPERLPETLRTLGLWMGRMRRSFTQVKAEIEKEIGMDEVKRQLHNEAIMEEMKRIEAEVKSTADTARSSLNEGIKQATPPTPTIDPNVHSEVSDLISAQDGGSAPAPEPATDDRDHGDAGAEDERDHSDAGANVAATTTDEDKDHTDAGAEPDTEPADATDPGPAKPRRVTSS
jgi:sec-independent protein translocase protein TatB